MNKKLLLGIGNVYLETNYLGLVTAGKDILEAGHEYRSGMYQVGLGGSVVNFLVQAKNLGENVGLVGKVGDDEAGRKVLELLENEGISTDFISVSGNVQTGIDTGLVFEHNGDNIQVVSGNANQRLALSDIDLDSDIFKHVRAVYLGGFFKQESLFGDYPVLVKGFKDKGIRMFMDHGRLPVNVTKEKMDILFQVLPYIEGYFQNRREILHVTGNQDLQDACNRVLGFGSVFAAIKKGKDGCCVVYGKDRISIPGHKVKVLNVVGAGDSFNAAFVTHLLEGFSYKDCAEFANKVASVKVSKNIFPRTDQL